MSEAFVYCWTDKARNMLYIGSHKGLIDDGYICSSKYMMKEYRERPQDFSRQIIAEGSHSDIRKLEEAILKSCNAAMNESFYNRHNNDGKFFFAGWSKETMTPEHRKKLKEARAGRGISAEHAEKLHTGRRASKNNAEHAAAVISSRVGSKHSDEAKKKMSEAKSANPKTKENASNAGKISSAKRPENYKEIQSARMKIWWSEHKKNIGG